MKTRRTRKRCRKVEYKTAEEARRALREQREIGAKRFYRCPWHDGREVWHLTSER